MHRAQFEMIKSGLGTGVLVVALFFQMLPLFILVMVVAHTVGVTGGGMLVILPVLLFAMVFAACWLASKRRPKHPWRVPARRPSRAGRTAKRRARGPAVLLKTRAERYQDLKDILSGAWR